MAQALERDRVSVVAIPRRGCLPEEKDHLAEDVRLSWSQLTGAMGRPVMACPGKRGSRRASPWSGLCCNPFHCQMSHVRTLARVLQCDCTDVSLGIDI